MRGVGGRRCRPCRCDALGPEPAIEGFGRVGWGFGAILLLSGAREAVANARLDAHGRGPVRASISCSAFRARLAGEALNTLLPMGMLVGEPTKATHVGHRICRSRPAFSALVVEFAFYGVSLVLLFCAGLRACFL